MNTETQAPDPADEKRADFERKVSAFVSPLHLLSLERDADTGRYLDNVVYGAWWGYCNASPAIPAPEGAERAAFEACVQQETGRDMDWHQAARTTGLEFAWSCWQTRAALAAPAPQAAPVAWVDERAIAWLAGRRDTACITTQLQAGRSLERPMPLYAAPQTKEPTNDR